jgi:hypothetical protein
MNREKAKRYVEYVVDDSGNGREWGADQYAFVRENGETGNNPFDGRYTVWNYPSKLVVWDCYLQGCAPSYMVVAVHSYLDVELSNSEVEELARDYLCEIGFFKEGSFPPDFIV